jgi:flagellar basal-body rod protein FlgG
MLVTVCDLTGTGAPAAGARIDDSQGALEKTDNPLDMALEGRGYFCIDTPAGVRYTRNGSFRTDMLGRLCNRAGYPVLGLKGSIPVKGGSLTVHENGDVIVRGKRIDTLRLVTIDPVRAQAQQGSLLIECPPGAARPAGKERVKQYHLEGSNVSPIEEMVTLIETQRSFQALGRLMSLQDEINGKAAQIASR